MNKIKRFDKFETQFSDLLVDISFFFAITVFQISLKMN